MATLSRFTYLPFEEFEIILQGGNRLKVSFSKKTWRKGRERKSEKKEVYTF